MHENSIQEMTTTLRNGIVAQEPNVMLEGTVECDEVYVVAGHKGHPESVKTEFLFGVPKGRNPRKHRLKGPRGRGTAATDKPCRDRKHFWYDSTRWSVGDACVG